MRKLEHYETQLWWAWWDYCQGYKKEALYRLIDVVKEYESEQEMEKRKTNG